MVTEFETFDDDDIQVLFYPKEEPPAVATPLSIPSTPSLSDSDTSLPRTPVSDDVGDAPFTPRSSHSRKKKEGHIPRPPNAFMIFRSWLWKNDREQLGGMRDHRKISITAGVLWKSLSKQQQQPYRDEAAVKKLEHKKKYPDYRYSPENKRNVKKRKSTRDHLAEKKHCHRLAKTMMEEGLGEDLLTLSPVQSPVYEQSSLLYTDTDTNPSFHIPTSSHDPSGQILEPNAEEDQNAQLDCNFPQPFLENIDVAPIEPAWCIASLGLSLSGFQDSDERSVRYSCISSPIATEFSLQFPVTNGFDMSSLFDSPPMYEATLQADALHPMGNVWPHASLLNAAPSVQDRFLPYYPDSGSDSSPTSDPLQFTSEFNMDDWVNFEAC